MGVRAGSAGFLIVLENMRNMLDKPRPQLAAKSKKIDKEHCSRSRALIANTKSHPRDRDFSLPRSRRHFP
jgi:hypothetical protein